MSAHPKLLDEHAEDLYENAPCGYLSTRLDGTIIKVNRTFESWMRLRREDLIEARRFQDLLSPGSRIYYETHYAPLLRMQGAVREIAVELRRSDGSVLPALVNSVLRSDVSGRPRIVRTTVFDATDRRRYEQELLRARRNEREIAEQLQRGLLSDELPEVPGLGLGVAYRPGRNGTEVGGDWFDVFIAGDTIMLVIGDVVGRGIGAAVEMGQLRSAVRALATIDARPAAILGHLDDYAERYAVGTMATLVCGALQPETGSFRFACAGHPPPLLLGSEGEPRFVWSARSLPLAVRRERRPEGMLELVPGTMVVLYTDGLVESRDRSFDDGLELLLRKVAASRNRDPATLAALLVRELRDSGQPDDVCALVARVDPDCEGHQTAS